MSFFVNFEEKNSLGFTLFCRKNGVNKFWRKKYFDIKNTIRYNIHHSLRVSVGVLYKVDFCVVELYNVLPIGI